MEQFNLPTFHTGQTTLNASDLNAIVTLLMVGLVYL